MKLSNWNIEFMREVFGVELTPDDHEKMVSELLERFPKASEVIVTKDRIKYRYDEAKKNLTISKRQLEQAH